ncbi:hypothetical protein TNCV_3016921 [Trichonephila clavipes]|nr:hypothetical protein TNCV_3016921 [Trichonephila clavipes]
MNVQSRTFEDLQPWLLSMKDNQTKTGYTYLLMTLPRLPLVGLELVLTPIHLILKNLLVPGNKQADKLAKEASTLPPPCLPIPLRNAKRLIKDKNHYKRISTLKELADSKSWSCLPVG